MLRHKRLHDAAIPSPERHTQPAASSTSEQTSNAPVAEFSEPVALSLQQPVNLHQELHLAQPSQTTHDLDGAHSNRALDSTESQTFDTNGPRYFDSARDVGSAMFDDFSGAAMAFDWTIASEDIFGLLRTEPSLVNLSLPVTDYSPHSSDAQTCLGNGSSDSHAPPGSVGASKEAVQAMSKIIKGLPAKLVAELENCDDTSTFFDNCMDLFFTCFLPTFPLLHKPTFHARECSPTLLLNILALGSSFISSKAATLKGESLWSLGHAVVATSWHSLMSQRRPRDECDGVELVQTAALGQIYSLLSGNYTLRMTSQIFHSLGFYWSRECGMYSSSAAKRPVVPSTTANSVELAEAWRKWASCEIQLRALLTHYILDGVIAQFSANPSCARHAANALPIPASATAFEAATAEEWVKEMGQSNHVGMPFWQFISALFHGDQAIISQPISEFGIRVVLECLQSMILEEAEIGGSTIGTPSSHEICAAMLRLHRWQVKQSSNAAELLLRWHCIFLSMTVNTRALCDQLCSDYDVSEKLFRPRHSQLSSRQFNLQSWTETEDARRALLHAFAIRDIVQNLPIGRSHAIHIPFAIFMAGTIQAAFMAINTQELAVPSVIDWEVVWLNRDSTVMQPVPICDTNSMETQQFLLKTFSPENRRLHSRKMSLEIHNLRMQLKSISSSWGICRQMNRIMEQWHQALKA